MNRIAIFIPTLRAGGAEKQACLLARLLAVNHEVLMVIRTSIDDIDPKNRKIIEDVPVKLYSLPQGIFSSFREFYRILKQQRVDTLFNFLTFPDFYGTFAARLVGVAKIYGGIRSARLPFHKYLIELLAHHLFSTGTIFNSYSGAEYFQKRGFRRHKIKIIHNCFIGKCSYKEVRESHNSISIISVGRFSPEKDYRTALLSIKLLSLRRRNIRYQIIGYGVCEGDIRSTVEELGLSDIVEIVINPSDITDRLLRSDIYLSTSLFEGTSNSILEAMDASLPIVATKVGDNAYLVEDGWNGYLHNPKDKDSIASSLLELIDNHDKRVAFGQYSYQLLRQRFSADKFVGEYESLLDS